MLQQYARDGRVIVQRADTSDVEGTVHHLADAGAYIRFQDPKGHAGDEVEIFVSYCDMRGVARRIKGDGN